MLLYNKVQWSCYEMFKIFFPVRTCYVVLCVYIYNVQKEKVEEWWTQILLGNHSVILYSWVFSKHISTKSSTSISFSHFFLQFLGDNIKVARKFQWKIFPVHNLSAVKYPPEKSHFEDYWTQVISNAYLFMNNLIHTDV